MSALPCPVADPFAAADQAYATITQFLGSEEARQVKHSDLERQLEEMGRELMRKLLQAHLELRQPGEAVEPVQDAAGATLTPTPAHIRGLESIFGTVEVTRTGYGGEGTASLHPLDGALNLPPEKYSLEVRRRDPPKRKKRWVALVDGNRMEIDHLDRLANEQNLDMPIVVDFIHVAQYVWEAAQALIPEDQQNKITGSEHTCWRSYAGRRAGWRSAFAEVLHSGPLPLRSVRQWTTVQIISSTTRPICSTTRCWPRASPSPRESLKAPVVIKSRTG